jgi:hypothetical protein
MRLFFLAISLLLLSGCITGRTGNSGGSIDIIGQDGTRQIVKQPDNSELPATFETNSSDFRITISQDRLFTVNPVTSEIFFTLGAGDIIHGNANSVRASTGSSWEAKFNKAETIMKNTAYVQYAGIFLVVLGVLLVVVFKVRYQALFLSALGVGMIVLQSTLSNPVWAWVMVAGLIVLPAFWLVHLYRTRGTVLTMASAISELEHEDPETAQKVKLILSKKMNDSQKTLIRQLKADRKIPT